MKCILIWEQCDSCSETSKERHQLFDSYQEMEDMINELNSKYQYFEIKYAAEIWEELKFETTIKIVNYKIKD